MSTIPPLPESELTLIHFNDVYNLPPTERDPVGGAARFASLLHQLVDDAAARAAACAVLFSGDALSPSVLANAMKGRHMVPVLNSLHISASCLGNHDIDHGLEQFEKCAAGMNFPWLVANARLRATGRPLGDCKPYHVFTSGPWRIGVLGLIEREWLETLSTLDASAVEYDDFITVAGRISATLREQHGCHIVIALTHMRVHNDIALACAAGHSLDLILGGHDHDYIVDTSCVPVVKSDSDFRALSRLRITAVGTSPPAARIDGRAPNEVTVCPSGRRVQVVVERFNVTRDLPDDPAMHAIVAESEAFLGAKMAAVIGVTRVPLVASTTAIRTMETNVGSFVADLMRQAVDADVALINGGTFRIGHDIHAGILRLSDLVELLPLQDPTVKVAMPGSVLLAALETSVSKWPATEGRFCQVSGLRFAFDPSKPPGGRVVPGSAFTLAARRGSVVAAHASGDDDTIHCAEDAPLHDDLGEASRAWAFGAPGGATVDLQTFYDAHDIQGTLTQSLSAPVSPAGGGGSREATDVTGHEPHAAGRVLPPRLHHSESAPDVSTPIAASGAAAMPATARTHGATGTLAHGDADVTVTPHGDLRMSGAAATRHAAWRPLDMEATYTVATKSYIADGKDGFDCFRDARVHTLIAADNGPILPTIVRNHFRVLAALSGYNSMDRHHPASMLNARRMAPKRMHLCRHAHSVQTGVDQAPGVAAHAAAMTPDIDTPLSPAPTSPLAATQPAPVPRRYALAIAPRVDGRITIITPTSQPAPAS